MMKKIHQRSTDGWIIAESFLFLQLWTIGSWFSLLGQVKWKDKTINSTVGTKISGNDLKDVFPTFERANLFFRISLHHHIYEIHRRLHILDWKMWTSDQDNLKNLGKIRLAFKKHTGLEFPITKIVNSVCLEIKKEKKKKVTK